MREDTQRWRRLLEGTVWGQSLLEEEAPPRYRGLYTIVLPIFYGLVVCFGMAGLARRVPSLAEFVSSSFADFLPGVIAVFAGLSLVGLVVRSHYVELVGAVLLAAFLLPYPVSVAALAIASGGEPGRVALAFALPTLILLPAWRISDLTGIIRRQKIAREAAPRVE